MDVLFRELGTPGVIIMVGIAALMIYSIMKGGSNGKGGNNNSSNSGGTNTPPAPPAPPAS